MTATARIKKCTSASDTMDVDQSTQEDLVSIHRIPFLTPAVVWQEIGQVSET